MKAETILKLIERALNPDLKEAHIKAYAQAMIEKDREIVKAEISYRYDLEAVDLVIDSLPINLD
jgi:hypothetical protein